MSHELHSYKDVFQEEFEPNFKNTMKKTWAIKLEPLYKA